MCSVLADEERWRRRYGAGGVHRLGTGQALRSPGSAKDRAHAQAAKHARRRVYQGAMRDACTLLKRPPLCQFLGFLRWLRQQLRHAGRFCGEWHCLPTALTR